MNGVDERLLIERAKRGDNEAFDRLIGLYQQKVYNTAYRMTGNYYDASDCTQEVFLRVFRSLRGFRGDSSFSTWIYHITVNVCKDELRSRGRNGMESIDELLETDKGSLRRETPDDSPLPDELYERAELAENLQTLINALEPNYRMVLLMREQADLSYQEIADMLGLSIGTVKSRISRARAALRKKIISDGKLFPLIERLYGVDTEGKDRTADGMSEI